MSALTPFEVVGLIAALWYILVGTWLGGDTWRRLEYLPYVRPSVRVGATLITILAWPLCLLASYLRL